MGPAQAWLHFARYRTQIPPPIILSMPSTRLVWVWWVCVRCVPGGGEVPPLCVGVRVQHSVDYSLSISCVPIVYMRIVRARTVTQN